jgi:hypothetical protein
MRQRISIGVRDLAAPARVLLVAIAFAVLLIGALVGSVFAGHFISPKIQTRTQVVEKTPPPRIVTATATATTNVVRRIVVPSPIYVTVAPPPLQMTYAEALAYCNDLAVRAWPDGPTTGDPTLNQLGSGYTELQRQRTAASCMTDHGYTR